MSGSKDVKEFPDLTNKLAAPKKQSLFERQKAEAEAKRIREEAETAAVLQDFVKSFDDEDAPGPAGFGGARPRGGFTSELRAPAGPPRRHFISSTQRNSGPGSLGPPSLPRKRAIDGTRIDRERGGDKGLFAYEDSRSSGPLDAASAFRTSDDEEEATQSGKGAERAAAKPALQLSSLPPGTSIAVIKALIPSNLIVDSVRVIPPSGPGVSSSVERKSISAIVAFAQDTPASDLDTAVSTLQNKYLGWGYNLTLSRHLSSAALGSIKIPVANLHSTSSTLPFGAQPTVAAPGPSLSRAPPPGAHRGGFAPPSSYGPPEGGQFGRGVPPLQVKVVPPSDIRQLKLIHKTIEGVILHGPDFEALLMGRPEVQHDENWAWIWNPRSQGGVWYRWRLWQIVTGTDANYAVHNGPTAYKLFEGGVPWLEPEERLPFEFTTEFSEILSASDYNSSDEDDSDEEGGARRRKRQFDGVGAPPPQSTAVLGADEQSYLNPMHKAKLTHLLARLPTTTAKLRKGDVVRVTAFAISHAGQGADEVVDMLVSNVLHPVALSKHASQGNRADDSDVDIEGVEDEDKREDTIDRKDWQRDISSSTLIGLYLISDILSASSTSGVRHAWRYRAQFEASLLSRNVFAYLGRMERDQGWGRLRAEKWRRSVIGVLQMWEGWCVFPAPTQERFVEQFNNPPLTEEEAAVEAERRKQEKSGVKDGAKSKWKSVDVIAASDEPAVFVAEEDTAMDIDAGPAENEIDLDGAPMDDLDGEPIKDLDGEDMDGQPMAGLDGDAMDVQPVEDKPRVGVHQESGNSHSLTTKAETTQANSINAMISGTSSPANKRRRPKAEDMFADSDED